MSLLRFLILLPFLTPTACQTMDQAAPTETRTAASELASSATDGLGTPESESDGPISEEESEEPELTAEDFEEGFCADDIYGRYLIQSYLAKHPNAGKLSKDQERFRRRYHLTSAGSMEALLYAKARMLGRTVPYYGAIPVVANESVELWITYFKNAGRREFLRWLVRGESVRRIVQPLLQASGVPSELFYMAMIESGFNNGAKSRARATGTWQFMKGTARLYGLKMDHWVDERRDPVKSSLAAASLLKDLYRELGDWYLAMAAYNSGPGKVRRAVRRAGTKDFWVIARTSLLAKETKQYVPKMLAALLLASNAEAYGFNVVANPADEMPETEVMTHRPIRLEELANELGVSLKTLRQWNPELTRDITPPSRQGGYPLRLTSELAARFPGIEGKLSQLTITDVQMHKVKAGDTLSKIARQYKVDMREILNLNPDLNARTLRIGREIAVPIPGVVATAKKPKESA